MSQCVRLFIFLKITASNSNCLFVYSRGEDGTLESFTFHEIQKKIDKKSTLRTGSENVLKAEDSSTAGDYSSLLKWATFVGLVLLLWQSVCRGPKSRRRFELLSQQPRIQFTRR